MAKEGLEKYNATGPTLGYLYQIRLALLWALRQARKSDFVVSVETLDDVSFSLDSDPFVVLQTKHSIQHVAGLGDYSPELWKTLGIWLEGRANGEIPAHASRFLISTSLPPPGSVSEMLGVDAKRNCEVAVDLLKAAAFTSSSTALRTQCHHFLSLTKPELIEFLQSVFVLGNQLNIVELDVALREELYWMVPKQLLDSAVIRLEGWWLRRVIHDLVTTTSTRGIAKAEIEIAINEIQEEFKRDMLPIDTELEQLTVALETLPEFSSKTFYKQLELVGVGTERLRQAVVSYLRAFSQRSAWIRDELVFIGELERYETRLEEEWSLRFNQICDELGRTAAEDEMLKAGRAVLKWAEDSNLAIRSGVTVPWVSRGSLHILADKRRVGWHPSFKERLQHILNAQLTDVKNADDKVE